VRLTSRSQVISYPAAWCSKKRSNKRHNYHDFSVFLAALDLTSSLRESDFCWGSSDRETQGSFSFTLILRRFSVVILISAEHFFPKYHFDVYETNVARVCSIKYFIVFNVNFLCFSAFISKNSLCTGYELL